MKRMALKLGAISALMTLSPSASAALLEGNTLGVQYRFPIIDSVYQDYTSTVVSGNTLIASSLGGGGADLYANDTSLTVNFYSGTGWTISEFNGFAVSDILGTIGDFSSVSLGLNDIAMTSGFNSSNINFDSNNIYVNWQGLNFETGSIITIALNGAVPAVPEPATWALMIVGFGAIGIMIRRKRRVTNTGIAYA